MFRLQRAGGIAALIEALAYVVGFAAMATLLNPGDTTGWSAVQKLAFVLERKDLFQAWTVLIYLVAGALLVVLSVALHERLKAAANALMQVATAFGLIWAGLVMASGMIGIVGLEAVASLHVRDAAQAASAWMVIGTIQDALGGGVELVGGVWVLLISLAAHRTKALPGILNYLGFLIGAAGILTVAPPLRDLVAVFGLGQIPWFVWIGVVMLRRNRG